MSIPEVAIDFRVMWQSQSKRSSGGRLHYGQYIYRPGLIDTGPLTEEADSYVVITLPAPWLVRCPTRSPFSASSVATTFPVNYLFSCHYSFCHPPLLLALLFSVTSSPVIIFPVIRLFSCHYFSRRITITFSVIHLFRWHYFSGPPPLSLALLFLLTPLLLPLLFRPLPPP